MLGIPRAALDEVLLNVFESELFSEIVEDKLRVHTAFASVYIRAQKSSGGESMDTDVAFCDEYDPAPTAGVFLAVRLRPCYKRFN